MNIILSKASKTIIDIRNESGIPVYIKRRLPLSLGTVIRWGSLREADCVDEYNTVEAIKLTSNKPLCRKILAENGIPVPKLGSDLFPCIGRTKFHTRGENFWFCRNSREVEHARRNGAIYFSEYINKSDEIRVHIGSGKVILYSIKEGDKNQVIWNHTIGNFTFRHIPRGRGRSQEAIDLAKKATEIVGLDFCAIDILVNTKDKNLPKYLICEINTTPELSELGIKKYSEYFRSLL